MYSEKKKCTAKNILFSENTNIQGKKIMCREK